MDRSQPFVRLKLWIFYGARALSKARGAKASKVQMSDVDVDFMGWWKVMSHDIEILGMI